MARQVLPSTVQIVAQFEGQDDGATGSGFALDSQGHFVTNNHVVADAAENDGPIQVVDQEGNSYDATVVGRSPTYDLAVLFVEGGTRPASRLLGASLDAQRRRPGRRLRLAPRAELHRHGRHRQRAQPAGHDR